MHFEKTHRMINTFAQLQHQHMHLCHFAMSYRNIDTHIILFTTVSISILKLSLHYQSSLLSSIIVFPPLQCTAVSLLSQASSGWRPNPRAALRTSLIIRLFVIYVIKMSIKPIESNYLRNVFMQIFQSVVVGAFFNVNISWFSS